jgi:hypothetical protein
MSDWATSASLLVSAASEGSSAVRYAGRDWSTTTSSRLWGGKARSATRAGAAASYTFTGRSVSWVAVVGPTRGSARVLINGAVVGTVNLYAQTVGTRRIVFTKTWSTSATRVLTIRVVGTQGHPRVDIDGFVITR